MALTSLFLSMKDQRRWVKTIVNVPLHGHQSTVGGCAIKKGRDQREREDVTNGYPATV